MHVKMLKRIWARTAALFYAITDFESSCHMSTSEDLTSLLPNTAGQSLQIPVRVQCTPQSLSVDVVKSFCPVNEDRVERHVCVHSE